VRRDAQTGIAALTPSERRITDHAASGATNPQIAQALFITVKTVEMHLHNAYASSTSPPAANSPSISTRRRSSPQRATYSRAQ
jgi:FixJ family two-component response regulator